MASTGGYAESRPHIVPETLDELTGPSSGEIILPVRLDWGPERAYQLANVSDLRLAYERIIREALRIEDLRSFLNASVLRQVWSELFLPARLRRQWEDRFPSLRVKSA